MMRGVLLVTDADQCSRAGRSVVDTVAQAASRGIDAIQLRAKDAGGREQLELLEAISARVPDHVLLTVNDRVDIVLAARQRGTRVDGVHLGQSDLPAAAVRALLGRDAVIGLTTSTSADVAATDPDTVDYVGIGTVQATGTKPDAPPPLGVTGFGRLAALSPVPAVAIGGITVEDIGPLRRVGAAGVAVVSAICAAPDAGAAAETLAGAWAA